jgi:L-threonylcarbamoyladenylate synthase
LGDELKTVIVSACNSQSIINASRLLEEGQLVAYPTDTVYGVGVIFTNSHAIDHLFRVKGRDSAKAIAILIGSKEALTQITVEMGKKAIRLAERFWPGPLTLIVPRRPSLPNNLSPLPTIGVRMPNHPIALALLNLSGPLATTSANLSGKPDSVTAQAVYDQLQGYVPLILDGGTTPGGSPSTVVDCTAPVLTILRPGPISYAQLQEALG